MLAIIYISMVDIDRYIYTLLITFNNFFSKINFDSKWLFHEEASTLIEARVMYGDDLWSRERSIFISPKIKMVDYFA